MMFKYFFVFLAIVLAPLKSMAGSFKDQVAITYSFYSDNVGVDIFSPMVSLQNKLSEHWGLSASFAVDAMTAASIRNGNGQVKDGVIVDAVSGASGRAGFDDFRVAPTVSLTYENGDFSTNFGSYYSTEIDFDTLAGFGSMSYAFNDANSVVSLGGSYEMAKWSPTTNRVLYPSDEKTQMQVNASIMQLINPTSYFQLRFSYIKQEGYLASPYRYLVSDTVAQFERYPELRTSYATALQYVGQIGDSTSIHLEYRYYGDDWDLSSHTLQGQVFYEIMENLTFGARVRGYTQSKTSFTKKLNEYEYDDAFIVSDYRLSAFASQDAGLSLLYKPGFFDDENVAISLSYDMYQTDKNAYIENWYGETQIIAKYGTVSLSYDF